MMWVDPQYWEEDRTKNGVEAIKTLITKFKSPLEAAGFEKDKVFNEWKAVQTLGKTQYKAFKKTTDVWANLIRSQQKKYPNILMLVELVICISSSNSAVERVFSTLTTLLSD